MGIGPVFAIPKLLERHGLTLDDIDLWELNEAFAVQTVLLPRPTRHLNGELQCERRLHLDRPSYGMTGARQVGHILREGKRRGAKNVGGDHVCRWRDGRGRLV